MTCKVSFSGSACNISIFMLYTTSILPQSGGNANGYIHHGSGGGGRRQEGVGTPVLVVVPVRSGTE